MTTKLQVSRLEVLDAVRDAIQLHANRAIDNSIFGVPNDEETREVDRLRRLRTALMAGAEVESE